MTIKFKAKIGSPQKGWLFIYIPNAVIGTRKRVWLKGTLNGKRFVATANPWKNETHVITFNKLMRKQLGIDGPTDVVLEFDVSEEPLLDLEIPPDLLQALNADELAGDAFKKLAPAHQKEFIFFMEEAKGAITRKRRLDISLAILRKNRHLYENPAKRFADDLKDVIAR
jgi:hypothetical protein